MPRKLVAGDILAWHTLRDGATPPVTARHGERYDAGERYVTGARVDDTVIRKWHRPARHTLGNDSCTRAPAKCQLTGLCKRIQSPTIFVTRDLPRVVSALMYRVAYKVLTKYETSARYETCKFCGTGAKTCKDQLIKLVLNHCMPSIQECTNSKLK